MQNIFAFMALGCFLFLAILIVSAVLAEFRDLIIGRDESDV